MEIRQPFRTPKENMLWRIIRHIQYYLMSKGSGRWDLSALTFPTGRPQRIMLERMNLFDHRMRKSCHIAWAVDVHDLLVRSMSGWIISCLQIPCHPLELMPFVVEVFLDRLKSTTGGTARSGEYPPFNGSSDTRGLPRRLPWTDLAACPFRACLA